MPVFNGTLKSNKVFAALFNMIISQQVFVDNVDGLDSSLVDSARVDGGLAGDTKLYYATSELHTHEWNGDSEATNLLALDRPDPAKVQALYIDNFRQIRVTIDNYLTKQAFSSEGTFAAFNSTILGWLPDTKKIYDTTLYNAWFGTHKATRATQNLNVVLPAPTDESSRRLRAQKLAAFISNLMIKMKDVSRDYNDYGFLRSWKLSAIKIIFNSEVVTEINKLDLPSIYNASKVFTEEALENALPAKYFGNVNESGGTTTSSNTTIRSLIEKDYNTVEPGQPGYDKAKFLFPGDLLPDSTTYEANETYTEDNKIVCKIVIKMPPYMSAFKVGTSFFNARSLTENHYITFGYNTLEHLMNYPFITIGYSEEKAKTTSAKA